MDLLRTNFPYAIVREFSKYKLILTKAKLNTFYKFFLKKTFYLAKIRKQEMG